MREAYIDACVLLNLFASGQIERILADLKASGLVLFVMPWVFDNEVFHVYERQGLAQVNRIEVDLKPIIAQKLITLAGELTSDQEQNTLIALSVKLDQGEAETLSAALCRGAELITDDGKTRKLLKANYPQVTNTTTVGLMKSWAASVGLNSPTQDFAEILLNIEIGANFIPSLKDPDQAWWKSITNPIKQSGP